MRSTAKPAEGILSGKINNLNRFQPFGYGHRRKDLFFGSLPESVHTFAEFYLSSREFGLAESIDECGYLVSEK